VSLVAIALAAIITLGLAQASSLLGHSAELEARAQTAADAAALAAIAESAPGGGRDPAQTAATYARLNDARVVECLCELGDTAMQVSVYLDGAVATARAVLDPAALRPLVATLDGRGLDPRLDRAVERLLIAGRGAVHVVSGWRSPAEQSALWAEALAKHGSPEAADDWVAPPGSSMHERGLAVDLGGDVELAADLVGELGLPLWRPLSNEPWHFELVGSRG
jgi:zinc D-Ala-D-Ala carboxypeptidase